MFFLTSNETAFCEFKAVHVFHKILTGLVYVIVDFLVLLEKCTVNNNDL